MKTGIILTILICLASMAGAQVNDFRAEVARTKWDGPAGKHNILAYVLACPWLVFGYGEVALRTGPERKGGNIDEAEFVRRKAALVDPLGKNVKIAKCVLDLKNDYLSLEMDNEYGFKTKLTATFFDRKDKPPVVALAYQAQTPVGPDEFSYLLCECDGQLLQWTSNSDVLDERSLDTFDASLGYGNREIAWECHLPQEGGTVEFVPHASTIVAGDPYAYNKLVEILKNNVPHTLTFQWNYARGVLVPGQ